MVCVVRSREVASRALFRGGGPVKEQNKMEKLMKLTMFTHPQSARGISLLGGTTNRALGVGFWKVQHLNTMLYDAGAIMMLGAVVV